MPEVRFYVKDRIYYKIIEDAQKAGLSIRQFLQQVVEQSYDGTNPDRG